MLRFGILAAVVFGGAAVLVGAQSGALKSGPQAGQEVPGPFHPLNVTGENAGKKWCLYCSNGDNPVAAVFAREATPEIAKLLKKLDEATLSNSKSEMGAFAVFCSDKDGLDKQLTKLATDQNLKKIILAIDNPAGPEKYQISRDAEVTVVLYKAYEVKANHAFRKGALNDEAITKIVADVSKIVK